MSNVFHLFFKQNWWSFEASYENITFQIPCQININEISISRTNLALTESQLSYFVYTKHNQYWKVQSDTFCIRWKILMLEDLHAHTLYSPPSRRRCSKREIREAREKGQPYIKDSATEYDCVRVSFRGGILVNISLYRISISLGKRFFTKTAHASGNSRGGTPTPFSTPHSKDSLRIYVLASLKGKEILNLTSYARLRARGISASRACFLWFLSARARTDWRIESCRHACIRHPLSIYARTQSSLNAQWCVSRKAPWHWGARTREKERERGIALHKRRTLRELSPLKAHLPPRVFHSLPRSLWRRTFVCAYTIGDRQIRRLGRYIPTSQKYCARRREGREMRERNAFNARSFNSAGLAQVHACGKREKIFVSTGKERECAQSCRFFLGEAEKFRLRSTWFSVRKGFVS